MNTEIPSQTAVVDLDVASFRYAGERHPVLHDLQLRLEPGSLTVVTGHSGSGKSTLGALLAGMLPRPGLDEMTTTFQIAGQKIEFSPGGTPRIDPAAWAGHIGLLPQDAGHYLSGIRQTVAEEIAFALENAGVPRARMRERVQRVARTLQVEHLLERDPERLSGGQRRLIALAALAVTEPRVLVLDEPLAGLDEATTATVTAALARLRAEGVAVLVLSSTASRVRWPADASWELSRGTLQPAGKVPAFPETQGASPASSSDSGDLLLEAAGLELGYPGTSQPVFTGLDLQLRAGQCLGLTGPNGAGKSSVLKAAAGLLAPLAGSIRANAPLGLLLQDPADQLFERTVRREVSFGLPRRGSARARVNEVLALLGLASVAEIHPYELPASRRRLVALATVLVREPRVLLLDEPTEALDAEGIRLLRSCIDRVTAQGGAVVLATHDRAFLHAVAHRVQRLEGPARSG